MALGKENYHPNGQGTRGKYRKWDYKVMEKAIAACTVGMGVREAARKFDWPRGK